MNKQQNNCVGMTICNNTDLVNSEMEYITKDILKNFCAKECPKLNTCHRIVELLKEKKTDEAFSLLNQ